MVFNHLFWQSLETFLLVLTGWGGDRERYRHLVDRGQNATKYPTARRAASHKAKLLQYYLVQSVDSAETEKH